MCNGQIVHLITGLPGSGKTELSKILQKESSCLHISSEQLRIMLFGVSPNTDDTDFSSDELTVVYDLLPAILKLLLSRGHSVIVEGVFRSRLQRNNIESVCELMSVSIVKYLVCADRDEIITRLTNRKKHNTIEPAGVNAFKMIEKNFELPGDDYIVIDTTNLSSTDLAKMI